jgi:hypothetical protein
MKLSVPYTKAGNISTSLATVTSLSRILLREDICTIQAYLSPTFIYILSLLAAKNKFLCFASLEIRTVLSSVTGLLDPEDEGSYFLRNLG